MLLRMYLRWVHTKGFKSEVIDNSPWEVASLKSVMVKIVGPYAYGWLRTEMGGHLCDR